MSTFAGQLDPLEWMTTQAELIRTRAYLAPAVVLVDDGKTREAQEKALREKGVCILVGPVTDGLVVSQAKRPLVLECENMVKLLINPARNSDPEGAQLKVLQCLVEITLAVRSYQATHGDPPWRCPSNAWELNTFSTGLWVYDVSFTREVMVG